MLHLTVDKCTACTDALTRAQRLSRGVSVFGETRKPRVTLGLNMQEQEKRRIMVSVGGQCWGQSWGSELRVRGRAQCWGSVLESVLGVWFDEL